MGIPLMERREEALARELGRLLMEGVGRAESVVGVGGA